MITQPALFISHGAPDLAIADVAAHHFLRGLGERLERPDAIVIVSAHHESRRLSVRAPERFVTWHDFGNFDPKLYQLRYEPPGDESLAETVHALLADAGLDPARDPSDRIDHGAWVPLSLVFPDADIPVVMVSIDPARDALWHYRIGRALAPLRDRNILLIGSGSISHNLREVFRPTSADRAWVDAFTTWLEEKVRSGDAEALLSAMKEAPQAVRNHPTDEHLLPFYFALGAGGGQGTRIHQSYTWGILAMDAYAFGASDEALRLAA